MFLTRYVLVSPVYGFTNSLQNSAVKIPGNCDDALGTSKVPPYQDFNKEFLCHSHEDRAFADDILQAIVSALTALSRDFTGLLLTRFFLGLTEAPYYPGGEYTFLLRYS